MRYPNRFSRAIASTVEDFRRWRRSRSLRRRNLAQQTERYWRLRGWFRRWRFVLVLVRFTAFSSSSSVRERIRFTLTALYDFIKGILASALALSLVILTEHLIDRGGWFNLIESVEKNPDVDLVAIPRLAVPVLAAFLGFYLATIGIVLGNTYHEVSAAVRNLVLQSARTKFYLQTLGMTIGAGISLLILASLDLWSFGYFTIGCYVILLCLGAWSFVRLAFGAFNLMNPMFLVEEPLRMLRRVVDRSKSKGVTLDDAVLRGSAAAADHALVLLAQLVEITNARRSVDREQLVAAVGAVLLVVQDYIRNKHRLAPNSGWFITKPSYPRWVETSEGMTLIASQTSTPLPATWAPEHDWLEKRTAAWSPLQSRHVW